MLGGLLMALAMATQANAFWGAIGTGSGSGSVATLDSSTLSGTPGAGTATLNWTSVSPPGSGTVFYYVQRKGGNVGGDCPTPASTGTALTCTDTGLSAGTYDYTVTAIWRTWTATSSPATPVTLASGALDHFVLAAATTTPAAGAADNLTVTAKDSAGVTVAAYNGSHNLTFTGAGSIGTHTPTVTSLDGTVTNFGTAMAINFAGGVADVSGSNNGVMRLYKVETAHIVVSDGSGHSNGAGLSVAVSAAAANRLVFTQSPGNTVAGVVFAAQPQVTVQDQFGNTVTGDASTVTLAIKLGTPTSGGPGSLTGCLESESGGVITFSGCTIQTVGTGYQLHATDGSLTAADSSAFTISPAAANKLSFNQSPGNTVAGVAFAPQPQVTVQDQFGNTVTGDASTVTLMIKSSTPTSGGPGSLTGCSQSESGGVITFSGCTIQTVGTGYQLHATDGTLTAADSTAFNITPAAANRLVFTQTPGSTVAGVLFAPQPQVTVQDQYGNTVTTDTSDVTIAVTGGTTTVTGCLNTKAATGGVATFSGCTITKAGTYTLTANDGLLISAESSSFTISPADANKLVFTAQPTNTVAGVAIAPAVAVTVQDTYGNTVTSSNASITVAIGTNPGGGTLSGTKTVAAVNGVATFSNLSIDKAGTGYTLTASSGGLTGATSAAFNIAAGTASKLAFTTQPTNTTGGATINSVAVTVQDTYGNTVTSSNASITVAIGTNPGGGTLSGTKIVAAVNGVATFGDLSIDKAGTGYTLTAATSPLTGATSNAFNITVGAASKLAFTAQPGGGASSTAWANQPTVTVQDAGGNTVTAAVNSITLAITPPGGAVLTCTTNPKNAAAGVDVFAGCAIDKAATYTLTATATGLTSAVSGSFNITVGAASKLAFTAQPGGGASNTAWANQPTVTVQDAGGNTVTTAVNSITLAITPPGGANLTCTANPKAAVAGVDVFAGCRIDKAGTYTLTATAAGLTNAVSNSLTITATVTFSSGPTLDGNHYLPTHVSGSGFTGSVTISWSYAWGGYIYNANTAADGSGNFAWNGEENCIDGYGVYQTTDYPVIVNATDGTHTATGTGILLCTLRPNYP